MLFGVIVRALAKKESESKRSEGERESQTHQGCRIVKVKLGACPEKVGVLAERTRESRAIDCNFHGLADSVHLFLI